MNKFCAEGNAEILIDIYWYISEFGVDIDRNYDFLPGRN